MLDINVKTIDGQSRSYSVPDNYTVRQFKEKIGNSLNIPVERQRLIFQGRELKDTSSLSDSDVNGKTLHLVQRLPPAPAAAASQEQPASAQPPHANPQLNQLIQQVIGGLGEFGQNATFNTTNNAETNGMEVHIDLGNVSQIINENDIRSRIRNIRRFLTMTEARLNRLRDIQSGAPLDDSNTSTIIVGSVHTTTAISDGNQIIGFETNQNLRTPIDITQLIRAVPPQPPTVQQQTTVTHPPPNPTAADSSTSPSVTTLTTTTTTTTTTTSTNPTETDSSSSQSQPSQEPRTQEPSAQAVGSRSTQQSIGVDVLADIIQSVIDTYNRFMPYLQQYHAMLVNDVNEPTSDAAQGASSGEQGTTTTTPPSGQLFGPNVIVIGGGADNRRQRFFNNINDMMHLMAHLMHNISDLHVNIRDRPPRQMHTMSSMSSAASQINSAGGRGGAGGGTQTMFGASAVPLETTIQIPVMAQLGPEGFQIHTGAGQQQPPPGTAGSVPATPSAVPHESSTNRGDPTPPLSIHDQIRATLLNQRNSGPPPLRPPTMFQPGSSPRRVPIRPQLRFPIGPMGGPMPPAPPPSHFHHHYHHPSTQNSYDPYLPCNSVHFYNSFHPQMPSMSTQRRRHPAGEQPVQGTPTWVSQQGAPPQTPPSGPLPNPTQSILNLVDQSAGLIFNQLRGLLVPPATAPPQRPPQTTGPNPNVGNSNTAPNQGQILSSVLIEALSLMNAPANTPGSQQRLNQPMREFLALLGDTSADEIVLNRNEQHSMANAFSVFFHALSLGDLIDLSRGQNRHRVFERTRQPLREHLKTYCPNSQLDIDFLCNRFWEDVFEDPSGLNIDFSQFETIDERVDFKRSLEKLIKQQARLTFEHVFDTRFDNVNVDQATETWSSLLFARYKILMDRLVNLCRACVRNADSQLAQIATERVNLALLQGSGMLNMGPLFGRFGDFIRAHIQSILAEVPTNRASIEDVIDFKTTPQLSDTQASSASVLTDSTEGIVVDEVPPARSGNDDDEDRQSIDSNQFDSVSSTLSGNSMDVDQHFSEANRLKKAEQRATTSSGNSTAFPPDWLPIIERDMEKQKKVETSSGVKTAFSDAYISGMPAKKRKILVASNPMARENSSGEESVSRLMLKKVLSRTIEQVELKPSVSKEQLVEASLEKSELVESFDQELDMALNERLRNDQDFLSILKDQSVSEGELTDDSKEKNDLVYNKNRFAFIRKNFK